MDNNFDKFIEAQKEDYDTAFSEIKSGKKRSHWMWYIFPQFKGLGFSNISKFYAINNLNEAKEYLHHSILGTRLREISNELLKLEQTNANQIFGSPDDSKLKSCMTLFSIVDEEDTNIFKKVIDKYFNGHLDETTIKLTKQ